MDLPTTKEKGKRVSTEIFDRKKFIAFLEEDSDHNSEVWSAFTDSRSSLPKKGDLVVYFPQGHLEYGSLSRRTNERVRTYNLQPQIICRVEHVQLIIKEAEDDIYANITLHPEPEVNSEEKELEQSDEIEDCIYDEDRSSATISTPSLFSKILEYSDFMTSSLLIPPKAAIEFFCLDYRWQDNESMDLQNEVTAKDFHGKEWRFPLIRDKENGNWFLGWREFVKARKVQERERVVFLREKDAKLRFGVRRREDFGDPYVRVYNRPLFPADGIHFHSTHFRANDDPLSAAAGIHFHSTHFRANDDPLSAAAGAILKKSIFSVMYGPRGEDFVIPYQKYMKSITRPGLIGATVHKLFMKSRSGFVTGMADLDPKNWPNSKWKCLMVTWVESLGVTRVSPWEISLVDSPSPSTESPKPKRLRTSQQDNSPPMPYLDKHNYLLSAIKLEKQKHMQESSSIHLQGDTTNHLFDIEKQTPAPQTSSQFISLPDSSSLTSMRKSKSTTSHKELISNCAVDDLCLHLKGNHSYEYLEFDSCSFPLSTRLPIPITIKKLKITNCVDTEQVFTVLMDPNLSVESLEIDSCSSFSSMSTGGIPATLRQLKIVNCMNLKSLSKSFKTKKSSSIGEHVHYSTAGTLQLRKLEIQNCVELEFLPKGLHKLCNLDILSINNCSSIEYFPEGGLPRTCLTSLSISECENLKCLPNKLHKVTSLQKLSISGLPSLMFFPEGGLPPNLVSLHIIKCENLISLSQWELHKLKHLRKYSFSCGY